MADPAANNAQIDTLIKAKYELAETISCTFQSDMFDYFKKLLSPALATKWQVFVEVETVGVSYSELDT